MIDIIISKFHFAIIITFLLFALKQGIKENFKSYRKIYKYIYFAYLAGLMIILNAFWNSVKDWEKFDNINSNNSSINIYFENKLIKDREIYPRIINTLRFGETRLVNTRILNISNLTVKDGESIFKFEFWEKEDEVLIHMVGPHRKIKSFRNDKMISIINEIKESN